MGKLIEYTGESANRKTRCDNPGCRAWIERGEPRWWQAPSDGGKTAIYCEVCGGTLNRTGKLPVQGPTSQAYAKALDKSVPPPRAEPSKAPSEPPKQPPEEKPKEVPKEPTAPAQEVFGIVKLSTDRAYAFAGRSTEYGRDKLEGGDYAQPGESFEDLLRRVRSTVKKVYEEK